jgi:hypothetical protein
MWKEAMRNTDESVLGLAFNKPRHCKSFDGEGFRNEYRLVQESRDTTQSSDMIITMPQVTYTALRTLFSRGCL